MTHTRDDMLREVLGRQSISPNTVKSRLYKVRTTLHKYARAVNTHTVRLYFGDMETGIPRRLNPTSVGIIVGLSEAFGAKYRFGLVGINGGEPIRFDNTKIIMIRDLTLNMMVYQNPITKRGKAYIK